MSEDLETEKCGIYYVEGIENTSNVKIIPTHVVDMYREQQVPDKLLESFPLFKNVISKIYECNLLDKFLLTTKKLPMMYLRVLIERKFKSILLGSLTLYFTITSDIRSEFELINQPLNGYFSIELNLGGTIKELSRVNVYNTKKRMINKLKTIISEKIMMDYFKETYENIDKKIKEDFEKEYDFKPPNH